MPDGNAVSATRQQAEAAPDQAALTVISDALSRIRFGDVRITIHEGRPVQVDVTEKTRLTNN